MNKALPKFIIGLSISFLAVSCSQSVISDTSSENKAQSTPVANKNSLSGREGMDNEILAVKIDDTKLARPQIGLIDADVVYIEQVEGGATRLAAIYSSKYPEKIGPVRSARISDLELLAQYGRVAFAFSGAQKKLRPLIDNANLYNLGADREGPSIYSRDPGRRAPWNMILNPQVLFQEIARRNLEVTRAKSIGWNFKDKTELGERVLSAQMKWPGTHYEIKWSEDNSGWLIDQDGTSKVDASGLPLVASTFVVQVVSITESDYGDKFGQTTPLTTSVGEGRAFVFRDGRVIRGAWSRVLATNGTIFTADSGAEIPFKAGQIWIALLAQEPGITYPLQPAATPDGQISGE
jgi:hypothetical protein